jgi:glycosyltransferase involved in cell wall biosynthesis
VPPILRVGAAGEDAVVGFWRVWAFRRAVRLGTWIVSEDPRAPKRLAPGARLRYWAVPEGVDASVFAPLSEQGKAVRRRELGLGDGLVFACPARADDDLGALARLWTAAAPKGALLAVAGDAAVEPSPGVRLLGPRADLYKVYQAADAAVFPPGASATDVLEAMATGLAVLAPSDRATLELVEEGRTGHVYEPGYPQQLESRLRDMLAKPARLAALGEEARSRVIKTHSYERVAHRYMDMLEGAVQAKTRFFMRK